MVIPGGPAIHVVDVLATTGVAGGLPRKEPLKSAGSTKVLTTSSFRVRFDRFLLPATAIRQSVCLQPLTGHVETLADCKAGVFLEPTYDPVERAVTYRQKEGARLATDTTYTLTVLAPTTADTLDGFRAFDGAGLDDNLELEFSTVGVDPPDAKPETRPHEDWFCEPSQGCAAACKESDETRACVATACEPADEGCAARCLASCTALCVPSARLATCAFGACHGVTSEPRSGAVMGLDLSSFEAIRDTAIGHVAHQTQNGEHAQRAESAPSRFGRAMPIIEPGNPGNSYLLYKLLIAPPYTTGEFAPSASEIERLRSAFVVGLPMPAAGGLPVPTPALVALSEWIAAGADVGDCP
jgi:hypothetical protein